MFASLTKHTGPSSFYPHGEIISTVFRHSVWQLSFCLHICLYFYFLGKMSGNEIIMPTSVIESMQREETTYHETNGVACQKIFPLCIK